MSSKAVADRLLCQLEPSEPVRLAQQLIRVPSCLWHESDIAHWVADWMRDKGFEVDIQPVPLADGGNTHQTIAWLKGNGPGPSLMLCGHLDTSDWQGEPFRKEEWSHDPFSGDIEDGYLYGLGALNMKGGLAAIMMTAEIIRRSGRPLKGDLVVACVAAETGGGVGALHLTNSGFRTDYCIVTEASNLDVGTISVGSVGGKIRVKGEFMHRVSYINPILKIAKVIQAFGAPYEPIPQGSWLRFNPHSLLPGFPAMAVRDIEHFQDTTTLTLDLRMIPGMTEESVREDMHGLLQRIADDDPDFNYELIIPQSPQHRTMGASPEVAVEEPIVQSIVRWHEYVNGQKPVVGAGHRIGATTDACHFKGVGIQCVEYGPGYIPIWPMVDERIETDQIVSATKTLALTASEICTR